MNIELIVHPSENYALYENLLTYAKNKHLPSWRKKFNKEKHYIKMTRGLFR